MATGPQGDGHVLQHPKTKKPKKASRWRLLLLTFLCCAATATPKEEDSVQVSQAQQKI